MYNHRGKENGGKDDYCDGKHKYSDRGSIYHSSKQLWEEATIVLEMTMVIVIGDSGLWQYEDKNGGPTSIVLTCLPSRHGDCREVDKGDTGGGAVVMGIIGGGDRVVVMNCFGHSFLSSSTEAWGMYHCLPSPTFYIYTTIQQQGSQQQK